MSSVRCHCGIDVFLVVYTSSVCVVDVFFHMALLISQGGTFQNNVLTDGVSSTRVALVQEVVAERVELASVSRHRKRVGFFLFDGVCVVIAVERGLSMIMSLSLAV